uniref:Nudix hydrolase domain-containing protein n=1 Tax=Kalanchoe fedtschenkoi TaxID=63787 RepID=A0A7N0VNH7_KALFE
MVCLVSRKGREFQRYNKGRRLVVGCIPYRKKTGSSNELEVLLVSSQKSPKMMFPKGRWELDESIEQAASRESLEEAGVLGKIEAQLGRWSFLSETYGTLYEGYMFPLFVTDQLEYWPEQHTRQRIWMSIEEAREKCQHWWMKEALDILVNRIQYTRQPHVQEL